MLGFASMDESDKIYSAIDSLGSFVAPILQGIHERTGLNSVLLLGGPVPKYGGDLRTIQYVGSCSALIIANDDSTACRMGGTAPPRSRIFLSGIKHVLTAY
jgi:hypothetical protein